MLSLCCWENRYRPEAVKFAGTTGCREGIPSQSVANIHIDESVFALSFIENVEVFKIGRTTDGTLHSFRLCGRGFCAPAIPHIYPSVGYWISFISDKVLPQPSIR